MKNSSVTLFLRIKLNQSVDLDNVFNTIQVSENIKCIKFNKEHKCNLNNKTKYHDNIFFSTSNTIRIKMKFQDKHCFFVKYNKDDVIIELVSPKKDLKINEHIKFVKDELQLGGYEEDVGIVYYSESWAYDSKKYDYNVISEKIKTFCMNNNYNYTPETEKNRFQLINIGSCKIRMRRGYMIVSFKKNIQKRMNDFKNFVKEIFDEDIVIKAPFKTNNINSEKKEIPIENIRIEVTI